MAVAFNQAPQPNKRPVGPMGRPRLRLAPRCPDHPRSVVYLGGIEPQWSPFYERRRWRCYPEGKAKGRPSHSFYERDERMRHPTDLLPETGDECEICERAYEIDEGPKVGKGFTLIADETAALLISIGEGESGRTSAWKTREHARRYRFDPRQNEWEKDEEGHKRLTVAPGDRKRLKDQYSKEGNLAQEYLDFFGPPIVAALAEHKWPSVLVIDLLPLRKRRFAPGQATSGGEEAGVICVIADRTNLAATHPIVMALMGGRNASELIRVFTRPDFDPQTSPIWIVADKEPGLEVAVETVWPNAVLFNCSQHLRMNAAEIAIEDGIPEWQPKPGASAGSVAVVGVEPELTIHPDDHKVLVKKNTKNYDRHPLHIAIRHMFDSLMAWDDFKARVEQDVPPDKTGLREWIRANEPLVLRQLDLAQRNPAMPTANGGVEDDIAWLKRKLLGRAQFFSNARRLGTILDLMTLERAHRASQTRYARIVREVMLSQGGGSGFARDDRRQFRDRLDSSSIAAVIERSDIEAARDRKENQNEGHDERLAAQAAEEAAAREAAGEKQARGRKRRPDMGAGRVKAPSRAGKRISDYPTLLAEWDHEANGDLRPEQVRATHPTMIAWVCRAHENDKVPHLHKWNARAASRTQHGTTGCPYCMNREVCPSNNLAVMYPKTVREWDYKTNGSRRPEDFLPGANTSVTWLCLRPHTKHPPYPQEIGAHIKQFQSCPLCAPVVAAQKRQAVAERKQREALTAAAETRKRLEERDREERATIDKRRKVLEVRSVIRGANELKFVPNPLNAAAQDGKLLTAMTEEEIAAIPEPLAPAPLTTPEQIEEETGF